MASAVPLRRDIEERSSRVSMIVSARTRWFAIATGCLVGLAGSVGLGFWFAFFVASFLVAGAIMQAEFPRIGRGLMCAGALWLSFWVFMIGVFRLREFCSTPSVGPFDPIILTCVALVVLCDVLITIEEIRIRRAERAMRVLTTARA